MKRQKIARPLVLAFVLAVGTATVWTMIVIWTVGIAEEARRTKTVSHFITVLENGTPLIQKTVHDNGLVPGARFEHFSLDGDPIKKEPRVQSLNGAHLWRGRPSNFGRSEWSQRVSQFRIPRASSTSFADARIWYFIHDGFDQGRGYFVAYELAGNRCTGYLSVNGFSKTKPSPDSCFQVSRADCAYGLAILSKIYWQNDSYLSNRYEPLLLRSGDQVMEVNLEKQTVRTVFQGSSLQAVARMMRTRLSTSENKLPITEAIAIRSTDTIAVVSWSGEVLAEYVLPESIQTDTPDQFFALPNDQALFVDSRTDRVSGLASAKLLWADTEGNVLDQRDVTLGKSEPVRDPDREIDIMAVAVPAPGIMVPVLALMGGPWTEQQLHPELSYAQAFGPGIARAWPALLGLLILGTALSWACVRRQTKYALPWTKTWATFVFMFGVAGYLAYLCHRRWPVREDCPECQKATPRDRDTCALCDAPFPAPEPKGIEVFA